MSFHGSSSFILAQKMNVIKTKLKSWNKEVFGKVETNKCIALNRGFWERVGES